MTTTVPFLRVTKLKDREIESILSLVIRLLTETALPVEIFAKILADLEALLKMYQRAMNRQRKSALTSAIRKIDELRNMQLKSFTKGIEYYQTLQGTSLGDAAELLDTILEKYGKGISRESDKVETVKIRSLLADLATTEAVAALELLNLNATIVSLNGSNEEFDKLYLQRAANEADDTTPSLLPTKKLVSESMYLLVYLVNFLERTEPEMYGVFAGELAEIIGDVMTVAKARQTRNSHEEEEIEEEEVVVEEE